jgi:hypothetical protein
MEKDLYSQADMELWLKWIESPEGRAREKLHAALTELSSDPEINASALCAEFLDLMLRLDPSDTETESVIDLIEPLTKYFQMLQARRGATAKLANDPKQVAKIDVRVCWEMWQKEPSRYEGKAEFARDMCEKYENLKNHAVIEGWCRKWERES